MAATISARNQRYFGVLVILWQYKCKYVYTHLFYKHMYVHMYVYMYIYILFGFWVFGYGNCLNYMLANILCKYILNK